MKHERMQAELEEMETALDLLMDEEDEPHCQHCGKALYEWGDLGCERCDRRHPEFGMMP